MSFYPFQYHSHEREELTKPRQTCGNIKGLELEISDIDASDILEELVEQNKIIDCRNTDCVDENEYTICVEEDGSVYQELIFKASCNKTLLKGVKMLYEKFHGSIANSKGTSCHIHINNNHLYNRGVKREEIMKATEFLFPILGRISGRDKDYHWCRPLTGHDPDDENLLNRAKMVDDIEISDYGYDYEDRYDCVNIRGDYTTEIRIFSNKYSFDYKYIKMYLETVDFIIDLAENMKGKSYEREYEYALELAKNHFSKRKYKEIYEKHELWIYFLSPEEQKREYYKKKLREFDKSVERFYQELEHSNDENINIMNFIRILRDNHIAELDIRFDIRNINYENIFNRIRESIANEIEE